MADNPITATTSDDEIWKRGWNITKNIGVPVAFTQYVLLLERRLCKLEQANTPAHLHDIEKR
jgi:hypothetical protein